MRNTRLNRNIWNSYKLVILAIIPLVVLTNFYGLNTHKFYWFKVDNFILPIAIGIQLYYLSLLNQRIIKRSYADFQLQKLEIAMYGICLIYGFELLETAYVLLNYTSYNPSILPDNFLTLGIFVLALQVIFLISTLFAFHLRKRITGKFSNMEMIPQLEYYRKS